MYKLRFWCLYSCYVCSLDFFYRFKLKNNNKILWANVTAVICLLQMNPRLALQNVWTYMQGRTKFYCKPNPVVMLIAIFKAWIHWWEAILLTAESLLTYRSRVSFSMLLTRDVSRLPQMEGFFAGYVTSGGVRPSDKGGGVVGGEGWDWLVWKIFWGPFGTQFCLKIRGPAPGASPLGLPLESLQDSKQIAGEKRQRKQFCWNVCVVRVGQPTNYLNI